MFKNVQIEAGTRILGRLDLMIVTPSPMLPPSSGQTKNHLLPPPQGREAELSQKHEVPRLGNDRAVVMLNKGCCVLIGHKKYIFNLKTPSSL
jgi:hypothetical protein